MRTKGKERKKNKDDWGGKGEERVKREQNTMSSYFPPNRIEREGERGQKRE